MTWSFRTKLNAGFVPALIFLAIITISSYRNTQLLVENASWVAHTHEVSQSVTDFISLIKDVETGSRGFVLTGDERFLEPYIEAAAGLDASLARVDRLTADNERQQTRSAQLKELKNQRIEQARKLIELKRRDAITPASRLSLMLSGRTVMDQIRDIGAEMLAAERRLLDERNQRADDSTRMTTWIVMGGGLISLLILLGATLLVNVAETRRLAALGILEGQNRLRAGLIALTEKLVGEQTVGELARRVIDTIAPYVRARVAAFFVADDHGTLRFASGYGFEPTGQAVPEFRAGDGLVGQAATQKSPVTVTGAPGHYLKVRSGLGEAAPLTILAVPFLHSDVVKGVAEFGAFGDFDDTDREYLRLSLASVAIAVNSSQLRARAQSLLEETQSQSEELQVQQEELRAANEELQSKTQELEAQQEELRQTNEELEEQRATLEEQTTRLEETNRDVVKARQEVEEKAAEIERGSKYKSEFLANMSHELRTPLNSILLLSRSMAENEDGNLTADQQEICRTVYSSGADLLNLINDILDLSKVEAGKLDVKIAPAAVADLAQTMENLFRAQMKEKGLQYRVQIAPDCPAELLTDRLRIEQILKNFLSNALKFTERGSVTLAFERLPGARVSMSVTDTGIGIPDEKKAKVFEAFEQVDSTTSRKYGGAGLGLTIARQLAGLLGGEIQIQSQFGQGSRFSILLPERFERESRPVATVLGDAPAISFMPATPSASAIPATPRRPAHGLEDDRKKLSAQEKSILIIEDDPKFAKILYGYCHDRGYQCLLAADGEAGLDDAHEFRPSAILLDLKLPGMSGLSVLGKLKSSAQTRHIPVHVISAEDHGTDVLKMGAIGFLVKPVSPEDIGDAIRKIDEKLEKKSRKVLVVEDRKHERESILRLITDRTVKTVGVESGEGALARLRKESFDCVILDLELADMTGFDLLAKLEKDATVKLPPVIVYTSRDLRKEEIDRLSSFSRSIIIKGVHSEERLLDEVTLFLHSVESDLPPEKRQILERVRHREELFEGKQFLVVDDDMRNVFALRNLFTKRGVEVLVAKTGQEALDRLQEHPGVHAVLMDIMMPEMDGYEAMRRIRKDQRFQKLPIIALTAKAMASDREKCLEAGANDYLAKPIDADRLLALLRIWLTQ